MSWPCASREPPARGGCGNAFVDLADNTHFVNAFNRYPAGQINVADLWRADSDGNGKLDMADISGMIASFFGWPQ